MWWRYIGNIFFLWEHGEESFKEFIEHLNQNNSTIKCNLISIFINSSGDCDGAFYFHFCFSVCLKIFLSWNNFDCRLSVLFDYKLIQLLISSTVWLTFARWWWIVFVEWLPNVKASFQVGPLSEILVTHSEQDLNLCRTWVKALLSEFVQ